MDNTSDSLTPQPSASVPATPTATPITTPSRWVIPVPIVAPAAPATAKAMAGVSANGSNANGNGHHAPPSGGGTDVAPMRQRDKADDTRITNFVVSEPDSAGRTEKIALPIFDIIRRIYHATNGWPRRVGDKLFADPSTPEKLRPIVWLTDSDALIAWLNTYDQVGWTTGGEDYLGNSYITPRQIFRHLQATAAAYDSVESLPYWPPVPSVYSSWPEVSEAEEKAGVSDEANAAAKTLVDEFLGHFNPATDADRALLRALFLTPFWGGECGRRPLFLITTADDTAQQIEQEAGKTTLAEKLASIAGGSFDATEDDRNRNGDDLSKRILSPVAITKRVMLLDNSRGVLADPRLAKLLTQESISGRPSHERQTVRPNRLTWVVTTNNTDLDTDLARRSVVLRIKHPEKLSSSWEPNLDQYIAANREALVNAAITILRRGGILENNAISTRFPTWDAQVLACHHNATIALKRRADDIVAIDVESEDCALFVAELKRRYSGQFIVELETAALSDAFNTALGTKRDVRWSMRIIRHHAKKGRLPMLTLKHEKKHASPWVLKLPN